MTQSDEHGATKAFCYVQVAGGERIEIIMFTRCSLSLYIPGWQRKQINTGTRPKISQRHRMCTHNRTYNLDYVSNNLDNVCNYLDSRGSKEKRD